MDMNLAGLPLEGDDDLEHILAAVTVVKGLDADGVVSYYMKATQGLTCVEALGMTEFLNGKLRSALNI